MDVIARMFFLGMAFVVLHIAGAFNAMAGFAATVQGILHEKVSNMYCINTKKKYINY